MIRFIRKIGVAVAFTVSLGLLLVFGWEWAAVAARKLSAVDL